MSFLISLTLKDGNISSLIHTDELIDSDVIYMLVRVGMLLQQLPVLKLYDEFHSVMYLDELYKMTIDKENGEDYFSAEVHFNASI
jgi:hypothetical protein